MKGSNLKPMSAKRHPDTRVTRVYTRYVCVYDRATTCQKVGATRELRTVARADVDSKALCFWTRSAHLLLSTVRLASTWIELEYLSSYT